MGGRGYRASLRRTPSISSASIPRWIRRSDTEAIDPRSGWLRFPDADDPDHVRLVERIVRMREGRRWRTLFAAWYTIAESLNAEGTKPPAYLGKIWHWSGVKIFYSRNGGRRP
jgi:hypothetical protein